MVSNTGRLPRAVLGLFPHFWHMASHGCLVSGSNHGAHAWFAPLCLYLLAGMSCLLFYTFVEVKLVHIGMS